MTKRRQLAVGALLPFVAGTLLIPALHLWGLACAGNGATDVCACGHAHSGDAPPPHRGDDGSDKDPGRVPPHDSSTCPVCQLAETPLATPATAIWLPCIEALAVHMPAEPRWPDFSRPRLLPFACGPPS